MKRCIVFILLLALPIRTVLAVSGFGCAMMPTQTPMQMTQAEAERTPCPLHTIDASTSEVSTDAGSSACSSCAAACCAALAPMPTAIAGSLTVGDHASAVVKTLFASAVPHTLERPPRFA